MLTAAVMLTVFGMITGCQAKPAEEGNQQTVEGTTEAGATEPGMTDPGATEPGTTDPGATEPGAAEEKDVDLEEVHTVIKEAYGEKYIPSAAYDEQAMNDLFGIGGGLYDSFVAEGPMISVHVDQFIAVKAKEGKGEEVEKLLGSYRDSQLNDALQYPMNLPKIEASEVLRHGDYVFFVMLGTPSDEALMEDEEAALESAKEQNKIAVDIINGYFS